MWYSNMHTYLSKKHKKTILYKRKLVKRINQLSCHQVLLFYYKRRFHGHLILKCVEFKFVLIATILQIFRNRFWKRTQFFIHGFIYFIPIVEEKWYLCCIHKQEQTFINVIIIFLTKASKIDMLSITH